MVAIRLAQTSDLPAVSALDARLTGTAKPDYWQSMLNVPERHFLVAESEKGELAGFIAGEVRAWEFGQPAAGWVFAIQIDPKLRLKGVGTRLFEALVARFKDKGVTRVRTLVDRRDHLILSFFRAQGMVAGPSLQLDMDVA
ncbi:MAG TPA: GNAT family N-acetyltransferase [Reyranella sp.]|jgi:ribosomal protein S18 acetylase RimI-like enzyme|nr:GNAT family N-acetyltransferase [Reyranella sp.]